MRTKYSSIGEDLLIFSASVYILFVLQVMQTMKLILEDKKSPFTEDSVINMLHFIAAMPVTVGGHMGENLCAMTVLPYVSVAVAP